MGKGDIKTKRGKRHIGSYGKHRPHKTRTATVAASPRPEPSEAPKEAVTESAKATKTSKTSKAKDTKKAKKAS